MRKLLPVFALLCLTGCMIPTLTLKTASDAIQNNDPQSWRDNLQDQALADYGSEAGFEDLRFVFGYLVTLGYTVQVTGPNLINDDSIDEWLYSSEVVFARGSEKMTLLTLVITCSDDCKISWIKLF